MLKISLLEGPKVAKTQYKSNYVIDYEHIKPSLSFNYHFRLLINPFSTIFRGVKIFIFTKMLKISLLEGPKVAKTQYKPNCGIDYDHIKPSVSFNYHFRLLINPFLTIFRG